MPKKTSPTSKTDASKISALAEQLAQREAELTVINSIESALASKMDFQGIIDAVGDKLNEIFKDGNIGFGFLDKERDVVTFPYVVENGKRLEYFELTLAESSLMRHVLKRRRPVVFNRKFGEQFDRTGTFNYPGKDEDAFKFWASVPIFSGDEVIGGISLRSWERENAFTDSDLHFLQTIASSMSVALENAHLLKETEQRATELQIINNIGQTLTEGLDLQSMLNHVGDRLREILKVDSIGIAAFDPKSDRVIAQYLFHHGERIVPDQISTEISKLALRFAARWAGRSWVVNTDAEKYYRKFELVGPPKSFVMLPLLSGKEIIGGISIADYEKENAFTNIPIGMLETISSNMGTAIQNVRLFEETQRLLKATDQHATELQIINNIGQTLTEGLDLNTTLERVGERLREALQLKSLGIIANDTQTGLAISHYIYHYGERINPSRFSLSKNRFGMRFAARVGGKPMVVNTNVEKNWRKFVADAPEWAEIPKAFVIVPLLAGRELVGSITIADYEDENAFLNLPIHMLETIASNMGTAIQNVRLFDETQRLLKETDQRATELQIINNIGQTLTESGDLESMIQRVGERIQEALNIKDIAISIFDQETDHVIAPYMVRNGEQIKLTEKNFDLRRYKMLIRAWARAGGGSSFWVVNKDIDKFWRKGWLGSVADDVPKSLIAIPFVAGGEIIGGITLADYERENAFIDLSVNLLETIASNMGTAIQNVRLFDETKRLFTEAEEARAAAEQANKAKSTFLANMSHELRTPLNAIMGFTQIVRAKGEGILPEKQLDNLDKVTSSSQHLLGLINTVLDIAKIEAGRMEVLPSKFNVSGLADQCANLATPLLKPSITLEKQIDETISVIYSDQDKIKQIVLNLLSNAAKFTHAGKIILKVEKLDDETVAISVKDSGIGISEEAVSRVFEEFQQADNTTTRQYGGTGLGLTISRNLARLLGGDLTATSELGKGSTFTLTIPMNYKIESVSSDPQPDTIAHPAESHSEANATQVNEKKKAAPTKIILIVEDTELNINLLAQLLEENYKLLFAKDGAQGVDMAQQENPDLILMDISLPIMNGYEAARIIRTNMASVPIIGLSAYAMTGDAEKAKEAGCNDYVTKPINKDILLNKIENYLR